MAKVIVNYVDEQENTYPESYWRPEQVNLNKKDRNGMIVFMGYKHQAAANNGKRPIGSHSYSLTPEQYDLLFSAQALKPANVEPYKNSYILAMSILDMNRGSVDAEGNPIMISFFDGALDV